MRFQGVLELDSGGLEQQWPQESWAFTKQLPSLTELQDRQSAGCSVPTTGKATGLAQKLGKNRSASLLLRFSGARKLFGAAA